jgi:DnaJ like chaperone protein
MLGKVLGGMIGAALGMLLASSPALAATLAAVGALLGHFVIDREPPMPKALRPPSKDELLERPPPKPRKPAPRAKATVSPEDLALLQALCPLFIEVARADAAPVQMEIRIIREFFERQLQFNEAAMEEVKDALKAAIASPVGEIEPKAVRARALVKPQLRIDVVRCLYDLGLADGDLQKSEQDILKRIVGLFNLSDEQLQQITGEYFGKGDKAYDTLGMKADATDDELKSAYRRLAAEHHPDRTNDGGERFRKIKDAYESLKKLRGF